MVKGPFILDMTMRVWNLSNSDHVIIDDGAHSEFIFGLDFSLFNPGVIATCSWDETICVR